MIAAQLEDISEERQEQIDAGVSLTNTETDALRKAIAEYDYDGWDIHSGQFIKLRLGAVYALYVGQNIGQGGVKFELEKIFEKSVMLWISLRKKKWSLLNRTISPFWIYKTNQW